MAGVCRSIADRCFLQLFSPVRRLPILQIAAQNEKFPANSHHRDAFFFNNAAKVPRRISSRNCRTRNVPKSPLNSTFVSVHRSLRSMLRQMVYQPRCDGFSNRLRLRYLLKLKYLCRELGRCPAPLQELKTAQIPRSRWITARPFAIRPRLRHAGMHASPLLRTGHRPPGARTTSTGLPKRGRR